MTPPVTKAARDAAAGLIAVPANAEAMRRGERDDHAFVLAFAKAIAEERERAARIAEAYGPSRPINVPSPIAETRGRWEGEQAASANIATAIRATVGEVGNG